MNLYFEKVKAVQLDLFQKYDEFSEMKTYLYKTNQRMQNIQRGAFRRIDDHAKHINALYEEVERLKFDLQRIKGHGKGC